VRAHQSQAALLVRYLDGGEQLLVAFNYSDRAAMVTAAVSPGRWLKLLDSASRRWGGPGSQVPDELRCGGRVKLALPAKSALVLVREQFMLNWRPPGRNANKIPPARV